MEWILKMKRTELVVQQQKSYMKKDLILQRLTGVIKGIPISFN